MAEYLAYQGITRPAATIDSSFGFVSSFRIPPERTYLHRSRAEKRVTSFGDNAIDQIHDWQMQKSKRMTALRTALRKIGLLRGLKTRQIGGGRYEVEAKVRAKGIWASLPDVGFGVSQFLPILVADLQLPSDSTLVLSQPEIHLHPSAQAAFTDHLIRQLRTSRRQYIIETHSEYVINRLRLAIVKGRIKPSDASVYFFENSPDGTIAHKVELGTDGSISNAPPKFFETYMLDVMDIAQSS
jgi:predicted ATPase